MDELARYNISIYRDKVGIFTVRIRQDVQEFTPTYSVSGLDILEVIRIAFCGVLGDIFSKSDNVCCET